MICSFVKTAITERKLAEFSKKASVKPKPLSILRSLEEKYVVVMKKLQFGKFYIDFLQFYEISPIFHLQGNDLTEQYSKSSFKSA